MNGAHAHLLLNHIPVVGAFFALALLGVAAWQRTTASLRLALGALLFVALSAIPTYLTGEPAEEIVEELPAVSRKQVHEHEEAAELALIAVEVAGAVALAGLLWTRGGRRPKWLLPAALVLGAVALVLLARAANLGGHIRHPEIRSVAAAPSAGSSPCA